MGWTRELETSIRGRVLTDSQSLEAASWDFGHVVHRTPKAVVQVESAEDVRKAVLFAGQRKLRLALRGAGHSQSGQSLSDEIMVDLRGLNRVLKIDPKGATVTCQTGITWRELLAELLPLGLSPPVVTNNLDVTVGGTLSTAGLGVSSWRYGTQADHCLECEVVTGRGEFVRCSAETEPGLFDAVRAGLGQFGVITEVLLRLRRHEPLVRTLYLLYDSLSVLLDDLVTLMGEERFDYLEAWCAPLPQGFRTIDGQPRSFAQWFFPLQATYEKDEVGAAADTEKLRGLRYYKQVHAEDRQVGMFFSRLDPLFALWKRGGFWEHAHPWIESVLPWASAAACVGQVLERVPPQAVVGGHILLWPGKSAASSLPLFVRPMSEYVLGFGVLPAVPRDGLDEALPLLDQVSLVTTLAGGKRYLSGWVRFDAAQWPAHYGEIWNNLLKMKAKYDPDRIFSSFWVDQDSHGPFGSR